MRRQGTATAAGGSIESGRPETLHLQSIHRFHQDLCTWCGPFHQDSRLQPIGLLFLIPALNFFLFTSRETELDMLLALHQGNFCEVLPFWKTWCSIGFSVHGTASTCWVSGQSWSVNLSALFNAVPRETTCYPMGKTRQLGALTDSISGHPKGFYEIIVVMTMFVFSLPAL